MNIRHTIIFLAAATAAISARAAGEGGSASFLDDVQYTARIGLNIGGAMPMGMPAEIRSLESYKLKTNPLVGIDLDKPLDDRWGVMTGVRIERKSMEIDARVKNYHMKIVRGGEQLEGVFTGYNYTNESQWLITVPVVATYQLQKVRINAGPYVSYATDLRFDGYAYDGYLRVDDPTGPKVELGSTETDRGSYDFSDDMRRFQWGVQVGADWQITRHWGAYAMLEWGVNSIHKSSFKTIEQPLYPVFGSIGAVYYW